MKIKGKLELVACRNDQLEKTKDPGQKDAGITEDEIKQINKSDSSDEEAE